MTHRKIRVGLDFDGVVAYNPLRIVRAPITLLKKSVLRQPKTNFYVPKTPFDRFLFWIPHQFSFFPGKGIEELRTMVKDGYVEAYIVSGRYAYLDAGIPSWLSHRRLAELFTGVYANENDEQPHFFKERMLKKLRLDYYIEDNLDIVEHLSARVATQILWIYNILDRTHPYVKKYPSLAKALAVIKAESKKW